MTKHVGLIVSLTLLLYMAVASEKMILVTEGYVVSRDEFTLGKRIYHAHCHTCHGSGGGDAPRIGDREAWKDRIEDGMKPLIARTEKDHRRKNYLPRQDHPVLDRERLTAAVAYLVRESRKKRRWR